MIVDFVRAYEQLYINIFKIRVISTKKILTGLSEFDCELFILKNYKSNKNSKLNDVGEYFESLVFIKQIAINK